ncbi:hypothetical protein DIPPA_19687 [Diplonema papillatum]|nr:hypothetical protein DIPPA_19687 [Diplonema papillatum]
MMVAINVTDPVAPSYMGHRMLPRQGYTYSYGRGIMVTATLGNGIVRVFQCGETGGLFVFSDTAPLPTPTPPTPLPPPPAVQPDCSKLSVKQTCLVGDIVMSEHMVEACKTEVCGQMTNSWVAGIDGAKDAAFSKAGDACTFTTSSSPGRYVCGPAPPYTLYIEQYDKDAFPDYSYVRDVDMPPQIRSTILVAGSYELTVMQLQDNNRIKPVGRIPGNYNGVLASSQYGTAFGLRSNYLDVIDITNPEAPEKLGSVSWSAYGCSYLAEHRLTTKHYVYVSCPDDGVWGIDVTDGAKPISINGYSVGAVKPATGKTEGLAVDWGRHLLFVATSGGEDSGVHMYNISSHPGGPVEITNYETDDSAYEIVIMGTTLYVSADTKLAIYDTTNYVLQQVGVCCGYGPDMHLRGLSTFGGLMYAADDSGSLLVMNVSNPALPFYIGHRSFSSSTGSVRGKAGMLVGGMTDGQVRVFMAGDAGGLLVYSDVEPGPTPVPETMMPAPPVQPLDCAHIYVESASTCATGFALVSEHLIDTCFDTSALCSTLPEGEFLMDTTSSSRYVIKSGTSCRFGWAAEVPTKAICGSAPPHTTYMESHSTGVLPRYAYVRDVTVLGSTNNDIVLATSYGVITLRADDSVGFEHVSTYDGYYMAVLAADDDSDVVFASQYAALKIISLAPPDKPTLIRSVSIATGYCYHMEQLSDSNGHYVYLSCLSFGIFAVDVSIKSTAAVLNNNVRVGSTSSGNTQGLRVDKDRNLMFAVSDGNNAAVHMLNMTNRVDLKSITSFSLDYAGSEIVIVGTTVIVAADEMLYTFETSDNTFKQIGWCCQNDPGIDLRGIAYSDGLIYASDYYSMLVVINATDPTAPYYVGHKSLPSVGGYVARGTFGMAVAPLQDGVVRVFLAAEGAGLFVFSDTVPAPTPQPPTPMPPPPLAPLDCSKFSIFDASKASGGKQCETGDGVAPEFLVDECLTSICSQMSDGWIAGIDGGYAAVLQKTGTTCTVTTSWAILTRYVCAPLPPLTTYTEQYDGEEYWSQWAYVDGIVPVPGTKLVAVATSYELTLLELQENRRFTKYASLDSLYGMKKLLIVDGSPDKLLV